MGTYHLLEIFPILFNIYLLSIFDIISKFPLISVHSYGDDIQLNVKCTSDINFAPNLMSNCITSIHTWLSNNSLSLNHNKKETIFLHLHSPRRPLTDVLHICYQCKTKYSLENIYETKTSKITLTSVIRTR